jgi:hypothetical protein
MVSSPPPPLPSIGDDISTPSRDTAGTPKDTTTTELSSPVVDDDGGEGVGSSQGLDFREFRSAELPPRELKGHCQIHLEEGICESFGFSVFF